MKELELKERDLQRKEAEAQSRLAFDTKKEQVKTVLEETKISQDASQAAERIAVQREKMRIQ